VEVEKKAISPNGGKILEGRLRKEPECKKHNKKTLHFRKMN